MSTVWKIIVGIDIGLTCTGVAIYCDGSDGRLVVLQKWPGTEDQAVSKVPTKLAYKAAEFDPRSWGFSCPELGKLGPGMAVIDMFKFYLNTHFVQEKFARVPEDAPKLRYVMAWYKHFLSALHDYIMQYIRVELRLDVNSSPIEFVFSIPTIWTDATLVQCFRELVDTSGFALSGTVGMDLTEGEAAAIYTAKSRDHRFEEEDAFMVCDAGGGTTDMCVLQVSKVQEEMVQLENLDIPRATAAGSVDIDEEFEMIAEQQLKVLGFVPDEWAHRLAHQVTRGDFQAVKINFGTRLGSLKTVHLPIPNSNSNDRIIISRDQLKAMFDRQIKKIVELIDQEIAHLSRTKPNIRLSRLFLAGGLGSSVYVQEKIIEHCSSLQVLFAPRPEDLPLAVCKGLVLDCWQRFSNDLPVIPIQKRNASYGILCTGLYNKQNHHGQEPTKNALDGRNYVQRQIDWLVLQDGEYLRGECLKKKYSLIIDADKRIDEWGFSVVQSTLDPNKLPTFLTGKEQVAVVAHVIGDTQHLQEAVGSHRRAWNGRNFGKKYVYAQIECELSARIGIGNMEFTIKLGEGPEQKLTMRREENPRMTGGEIDCLVRSVSE